jgi:transposase InsO family protein
MDTIDFGGLFAFTAIDIFTKEADILLAPELTAKFGRKFLNQSMGRRFDGHVQLLQTDGGPEFKAEFASKLQPFCDRHRVARPYRKNEQSYIESFNRTVRKECLGWQNYSPDDLERCDRLVENFLNRYHYHRPHMGRNMTPPLTKRKESNCRIFTEN